MMQTFKDMDAWRAFRKTISANETLGLVATMGNLHAGHAALIAASKAQNTKTVVTVFVNPTQFNQPEDFIHYPRTLEADLALLAKGGVDYCLFPSEEAMYSEGFRYQVEEKNVSKRMEGASRPGHFTGVLTVVMKLLNVTKPHRAYFGEKDYEQYLLIRDMVQAFFLDIEIIACPTVRESSHLAFSSRNNRLNSEQRALAERFAAIFHQKKSCDLILEELKAAGIAVEYLEDHASRRFAAVRIGEVRLIDNYPLPS